MYAAFILLGIVTIFASKKLHSTYINPYTVLCAPYLVVVFVNKLYGEKMGFYGISDNTLLIIGSGLLCFFIGTLISAASEPAISAFKGSDESFRLANYNLKAMMIYCLIAVFFGLLKVVLIMKAEGLSGITKEGRLISGPIGHLLISTYPLQPFLLLYWLKTKKTSYLITFMLFLIVLFGSFIKYHVIGMIVCCFLFVVLTDRKYLVSGAILLVGIVAALFILNYIVDFISSKIIGEVNRSFYFNHLWKYTVGAVINGEKYCRGEIGGTASIGYKLMMFLMALPNMFISKLTGRGLFPYEMLDLVSVSYFGEDSNVVDAISYMYSYDSGLVGAIEFGVVFLVFGFFMERLYIHQVIKTQNLQITLAVVFTFFLFFSFFGTFYVNSMPWELVAYSCILPPLFNKKAQVQFAFR